LSGNSVVQWPDDEVPDMKPVRGQTRVIRDGVRVSGSPNGCSFPGEVRLAVESVVSISELAVDYLNCRQLVKISVGDPIPTLPLAVGTGKDNSSSTLSGVMPAKTASASSLQALSVSANPNYEAKTRSQVREPLYGVLHATTETNAIVDVYGDAPMYAPSGWSVVDSWFTTSGWYRTSAAAGAVITSTYLNPYMYSQYRNDKFGKLVCQQPGSTYAKHWGTQVFGYVGYATYSTNTTHWGSCDELLRFSENDYFTHLTILS